MKALDIRTVKMMMEMYADLYAIKVNKVIPTAATFTIDQTGDIHYILTIVAHIESNRILMYMLVELDQFGEIMQVNKESMIHNKSLSLLLKRIDVSLSKLPINTMGDFKEALDRVEFCVRELDFPYIRDDKYVNRVIPLEILN